MRWPQEPTGDVGLPVTLLNADSWVASLLLIRTAIASSFVNKSDGHTLEIASRRSKHCKPVINSATWVDPSHLRVQLSHAVVASLVADILKCRTLAGGPSHFPIDCRLKGSGLGVTLTFEFAN